MTTLFLYNSHIVFFIVLIATSALSNNLINHEPKLQKGSPKDVQVSCCAFENCNACLTKGCLWDQSECKSRPIYEIEKKIYHKDCPPELYDVNLQKFQLNTLVTILGNFGQNIRNKEKNNVFRVRIRKQLCHVTQSEPNMIKCILDESLPIDASGNSNISGQITVDAYNWELNKSISGSTTRNLTDFFTSNVITQNKTPCERLINKSTYDLSIVLIILISIILLIITILTIIIVKYWLTESKKSIPKNCLSPQAKIELVEISEFSYKSLRNYFMDAYKNLQLYNQLKDRYLIIEDSSLVSKIGEKIEMGTFGFVYQGKYKKETVAIKIMEREERICFQNQLLIFLLEADITKDFEHQNVLSMKGVTIVNEHPAILFSFMNEGNLLSYVRNNHPSVRNLLEFAIQICHGMEYLSSKQVIHCNLLARNCLIENISGQLVVKIYNFKSSRRVNMELYYGKNRTLERLPYRWMPIEVLRGDDKMTTKTDVWSYGVLLWELFTQGLLPYGDISPIQLERYLKEGNRLTKPMYCLDILYSIMISCWNTDPNERPTFAELLDQIQEASNIISLQVSPPVVLEMLGTHENPHKSLKDYFQFADENLLLYHRLKDLGFIMEDVNRVYKTERIGSGNFGFVYRGIHNNEDVAIKTLKRKEGSNFRDQLKAFFMEADTMKNFEHDNVLSLKGVTLLDDHPAILLPFMNHGDLLSYVKNATNHPNVRNLLELAIQICQGMHYLSSKQFIHGDLAARNCLVGDINGQLVVKVSDFGLSRRFYMNRAYCKTDFSNLPFRWMPIELLQGDNVMTTKSDVWSYGVVVWELITRGQMPYGQLQYQQIKEYLSEGNRLMMPSHCPDLIYSIMMSCWYKNSDDRPTFAHLLRQMQDALRIMQLKETNTYVNIAEASVQHFNPCPVNFNEPNAKGKVSAHYNSNYQKAIQC